MKTVQLILLSIVVALVCSACSNSHTEEINYEKTIYLIGASMAYPENTWFEMGCEYLSVSAINRASGNGTRIGHSAVSMHDGCEYTLEELDRTEVFVIMHTHEQDVCDEQVLLDDYNSYEISPNMNYSQAFDYVIRKYRDDCRALEYNPESIWYGVGGGKPCKILLCTYWHDARVIYNSSVRRLADKWSDIATLCCFDDNIGFTKDRPDPETGEQISIRYAQNGVNDTEVLYGVTYGWHPTRGRDAEIQQRMARIFVDAVKDLL